MLPLSFDSALEINKFRTSIADKFKNKVKKQEIIQFIKEYLYLEDKTAESIYNYFYEQFNYFEIPNSNILLVERYNSQKNYLIFHSMYGRRVNDALSRAIGFMLGRAGGRDVEMGINDNSFYIAGEKMNLDKVMNFLTPANLEEVLREAIEKTDVLARRFRHCATRSLMILKTYKGQTRTVGKQQMKSHFVLAAVKKLSLEFPILREARREVLEDLMDIENAKIVLGWIKEGRMKMKIRETSLPSPFALGIIMQGQSDMIRIEDKQAFLKRMHELHLKEIKKE
jgi:ATP-dependent Lhr-like helicase